MLCLTLLAAAQDLATPPSTTLAIGDPAPPLVVDSFLKGAPIERFEPGNVYVVEFWATWCGPCLQHMPQLSALQSELRDDGVRFVGVNVRELRRSGPGWEEHFDEAEIASFVERQGDRINYSIAFDGPDKATDRAWMEASGSSGLPTAFLVDRRGRLAWFGHPMILRMPLEAVVAGEWDLTSGPAAVRAAEEAFLGALRLLASDLEAGAAAWRAAAAAHPALEPDLVGAKFDALMAADHVDAAMVTAERVLLKAADLRDHLALERLAWAIAGPRDGPSRGDLTLALTAARLAKALTAGTDARALNTLARVQFAMGANEGAVETQRLAVEKAGQDERQRLERTLEVYRQALK